MVSTTPRIVISIYAYKLQFMLSYTPFNISKQIPPLALILQWYILVMNLILGYHLNIVPGVIKQIYIICIPLCDNYTYRFEWVIRREFNIHLEYTTFIWL